MKLKQLLFGLIAITAFNALAGPFSGTYLIGVGGDYIDLSTALIEIETNGMSGPVTFRVKSDTYSDQMSLGYVPGSSPTNTFTIEAVDPTENMAIVEHNTAGPNDNYVFKLDSAQNVIFKGMSFKSTTGNYGRIFDVKNGTSNIKWENCFFENAVDLQNFGDTICAIYGAKSLKSRKNLQVLNCKFSGGSYGVFWESESVVSGIDRSLVISGSTFQAQSVSPIKASFLRHLEITHCVLEGDQGYGINLFGVDSSLHITHNHLKYTLASGGQGITVANHDKIGGSGEAYIINNRVSFGSGTPLSLSLANYTYIYHNTIYSKNTANYNTVYLNGGDFVEVKNNIFINSGQQRVMTLIGSHGNSIIDHNNYFFLGVTSMIDYTNGATTSFDNLIDFSQTTNFDLNSHQLSPELYNVTDLDLGCSAPSQLMSGTSSLHISVPDDAFGRTRGATPWMGAAEYQYSQNSLIGMDGYVYNGTDTVKYGTIEFYADSSSKKTLDKVGEATIASDGSYSVSNIPSLPLYILVKPNSSLYPNFLESYHDTSLRAEDCTAYDPANCGSISKDLNPRKIETLVFDGEGVIKGKVVKDDGGTNKTLGTDPIPGLDVVLDKIPPSKSVAHTTTNGNGEYVFSGLPDGVYVVTIEYGGLNTDTLYEVEIVGNDTLHSDLDYCVDTTSMILGCHPTLTSVEKILLDFNGMVYPNPFNSTLNISYDVGINEVQLYDLQGKEVIRVENNTTNLVVDTESIKSGLYMLKVFSEGKIYTKKIVKY